MALTLSQLKPSSHRAKPGRRVGRGNGSTKGSYSGKGIKGQKARTGGRKGLKRFGMKRIIEALPKQRGFQSQYSKPTVVNVGDLSKLTEKNINPSVLKAHGLIESARTGVKILGEGDVKRAFTVSGCTVSAPARAKIEAAGGSVTA